MLNGEAYYFAAPGGNCLSQTAGGARSIPASYHKSAVYTCKPKAQQNMANCDFNDKKAYIGSKIDCYSGNCFTEEKAQTVCVQTVCVSPVSQRCAANQLTLVYFSNMSCNGEVCVGAARSN